ncbi:MAG: outer membrane beta-barrel protein [Desulfobulbaceae bacterium]
MIVSSFDMVQACAVCFTCLALAALPAASQLHAGDTKPLAITVDADQPDAAARENGPGLPPEAPDPVLSESIIVPDANNGPVSGPGYLFGSDDPDRLFGLRGGFLHPSLLLKEEWTDNLYNIRDGKKSNFLTVVSPGIWLGFPRMEEAPLNLTLNNGAVGGYRFLITDSKSFERFQAYLAGTLDYKLYSADSDLNETFWQALAFARYNMPSGLSFHILDNFSSDRDRFDRGSFPADQDTAAQPDISDSLQPAYIRDYTANLFNSGLKYELRKYYTLAVSYTNFILAYDDENDWLSRSDNTYTLSVTYHLSPKTSFFAEYSYGLVSYDEETNNDSINAFYYGGVTWKSGSRTSISAKGGYQTKEYKNIDVSDSSAFSMEAVFDYLISDKTKISFIAYKALEETSILGISGMDTIAGKLRYEQRFTYRLAGSCELAYEENDHSDFLEYGSSRTGEPRLDRTYSIRPALRYIFRDWLTAELSYTYDNRDSSDIEYDFSTQTVFLGLKFAL